MKPGTARVLDLLRARPHGVTAIDALSSAGSFRLAARVAELREAGYTVETELIRTGSGKRIASYKLVEPVGQLRMALA